MEMVDKKLWLFLLLLLVAIGMQTVEGLSAHLTTALLVGYALYIIGEGNECWARKRKPRMSGAPDSPGSTPLSEPLREELKALSEASALNSQALQYIVNYIRGSAPKK